MERIIALDAPSPDLAGTGEYTSSVKPVRSCKGIFVKQAVKMLSSRVESC